MSLYKIHDCQDTQAVPSLKDVQESFQADRKIIFIIGAGASQSAGVSTFSDRQSALAKHGGRSLLSETSFRTPEAQADYLEVVEDMVYQAARAVPTPFHWMLDNLARQGRNFRVYTQNIDGLELRCPRLTSRNIVPMHGQITKMACPVCSYISEMDIVLFQDGKLPPCPECPHRVEKIHPERTRPLLQRPASRVNGSLKPYILLYDSEPEGWPGLEFSEPRTLDTHIEPPDTVVVVGTRLSVPGTMRLTSDLCKAALNSSVNGLTLWVNVEDMPKKIYEMGLFSYALKMTSDQFSNIINV